jgi:hypothetical protein
LIRIAGLSVATVVPLPSNFTYGAQQNFTAVVVGLNGYPTDKEFTFDFQRLTFIDGTGLTVFCNAVEWLLSLGVKVQFQNFNYPANDALAYLDDCGFFQRHLNRKLRPYASVRGTTLPFVKVAHADAHGWLEFNFTPWMSRLLGVEHGALASVRASVKEVFNNILDHSTQEIGFVHVQHYPRPSLVKVTISDFGKGIPANVRTKLSGIDDGTAILRATDAGFTTKSIDTNQGVGLAFLLECVTNNHGTVCISSFQGTLLASRDWQKRLRRHHAIGTGSYPGTLVELTLRTDRFVGDDPEEAEVKW